MQHAETETQIARIGPDALAAALLRPGAPVVVDVRTADEYFDRDVGRVPGALWIPLEHLLAESDVLRQLHAPIVVACRVTIRAVLGASVLARVGITDVAVLEGGIVAWKAAGRRVETE
ncbi:MAG: rhodanese-like domain-containing protein [Myxococcales bacterium]|nr:rhodanese-like domain-containing protein [Myxococcales bacterium]